MSKEVKGVEKREDIQLDANEQQLIAQQRERKVKLDKANKAILATLKKHEATLQINPHSPIGNPQIIVVLNK